MAKNKKAIDARAKFYRFDDPRYTDVVKTVDFRDSVYSKEDPGLRQVQTKVDLRNAFYNAGDPRRALERADSEIVGYDYNAMANCPTEGFQTYFPGRPWKQTQCEE